MKLVRLLSDLDEALPLLRDKDPMVLACVELQFEEIDACIRDSVNWLKELQLHELVADALAAAKRLSAEQRAEEARAVLREVSRALAAIAASGAAEADSFRIGGSSPTIQ